MIKEEDIIYMKEKLSFWKNLTPRQETLIFDNTALVHYAKGQNIHNADRECVGIMLVKSGELRTYILSEDGREITLYRLNSGDVCILSASCVLKSITFDVHIDAECSSEVILINAATFSTLIKENIYVENFSLRIGVEKFSDVMWAMEQILFMSFDKRLAVFLVDETAKTGADNLTLTHEQIAKYMGSAREVVSRMLKYFAKEGIVELYRGGIKIIDYTKLKSRI